MDALIFDFDGVIVDSEPIHLIGFQETLRTVGVELTQEEYYSRYLGFDDHDCFVAALRDHGREIDQQQLSALIAAKTAVVQRALAESIQPLPGAVELIRSAHQARVPLAICSGALREEVLLAADAVGVRDCFQSVVAAEDVQAGKPDPEGYERARRELAEQNSSTIPSGRCVVVEDSPAGIQAAKAAGMQVLAVTTSYQAGALTQADQIVSSLDEVTLDGIRAMVGG